MTLRSKLIVEYRMALGKVRRGICRHLTARELAGWYFREIDIFGRTPDLSAVRWPVEIRRDFMLLLDIVAEKELAGDVEYR